MNYLSQILFFFGAIGAFNSLILAFYLSLSKSYAKLENRLFGLFLLILSLRVLKSLFYSFSTEEPIWFLQSGPAFFLLIGPLLFSYTLSIISPNSFWIKYWKSHIAFWVCVVVCLMFLIPFKDYVQLHKTTILPIINAQWFVYIIISIFFIQSNYENSLRLRIKWLIIVTAAVLIIWTYFTFISFDYFVGCSIIFSTIFYLSFLFFLINKKIASKIFEKRKVIKSINISKESEKSIEQLIALMISEKPHKNPDLKLADVAQNLDISSHELSKLINENLQISFTEFINKYRVEEAKLLITTNSNFTIEAIGNISGFNSKSAFYKAFKIHTGTTPSKYESHK